MVNIEHLDFAVGNFALSNVCLHVEQGEYFVLLGPTGSGKTLLVECLAGLNRIDAGRISIGNHDVTRLEPRLRRVGYLPQDYALFPHMTVRQNIAFGLGRRKGMQPEEKQRRLEQMMKTVAVQHLAERSPEKLSGGEKQRVALARALAVEPDLLLLDEPVSALDEHTRDGICRELKRLQRETGTTTIHVCHNFAEMLIVADRVGIIQQGTLLQTGTPREVLERPLSTQVAQFVRAGNLFSAQLQDDGQWVRLICDCGIELHAAMPKEPGESEESQREVGAMVRPENIRLLTARPHDVAAGVTVIEGSIAEAVDFGPLVELNVDCVGGGRLLVSLGKSQYHGLAVGAGDGVFLEISPENVHLMQE